MNKFILLASCVALSACAKSNTSGGGLLPGKPNVANKIAGQDFTFKSGFARYDGAGANKQAFIVLLPIESSYCDLQAFGNAEIASYMYMPARIGIFSKSVTTSPYSHVAFKNKKSNRDAMDFTISITDIETTHVKGHVSFSSDADTKVDLDFNVPVCN